MIRFYKNRYKFFAISAIFMIIGIIFIAINGVQLDIQFKGGAILKYNYNGELDLKSVETTVQQTLNRNVSVQTVTDIANDQKRLVLNMAGNESLSVQEQQSLDDALLKNFSENSLVMSSSNTVEPFIGRRFLNKGLISIAIASILIVFYVWIRFKSISGLSAGVMALVALLHDCIIVFLTFIIFRIPINESFVAVILTIIGYSVNDTIIIYDRIRENARQKHKLPLEELVDTSITQSMSRSINTCCTTLASAVIVFVFAYAYGIDGVSTFALPMAIGLVSGCYSTICIAGPLWVMWQKHKQKVNLKTAKRSLSKA